MNTVELNKNIRLKNIGINFFNLKRTYVRNI